MQKRSTRLFDTDGVIYTVIKTPLGRTGLAATQTGLCRIVSRVAGEREFVRLLRETVHPAPWKQPEAFAQVIEQFHLYFAGRLEKFTCPLDMSRGTLFQRRVWRALLTIPYGATRSYQWLAKSAGRPKAYRAAGNANGRNPLPIIVPCHRVIRENGELGGYTGGTGIKRFLLDLEKTSNGTA